MSLRLLPGNGRKRRACNNILWPARGGRVGATP